MAGPGDAAGLLGLKENLDRETSFMLLEPGERTEDHEDVAGDLGKVAGTINSVVMVAESAGRLVGYADARGGRFRRNRITTHVVIGVLAAASGHGAGSGLLSELELWAVASGVHRLELTVMAHNRRPGSCMSARASPSKAAGASALSWTAALSTSCTWPSCSRARLKAHSGAGT